MQPGHWRSGSRDVSHARIATISTIFALMLVGPLPKEPADAQERRPHGSTVGVTRTINDLVLPGTSVEAVPVTDRRQPVVVRIIETKPHGSAHRYTLEFVAFEPGVYDLRKFLRREDASDADDLPAIPVVIGELLAPDQLEPRQVRQEATSWFSGYRLLLVLATIVWVAVLVLLLRRRPLSESAAGESNGPTFVERLAPFLAELRKGDLDEPQRAELERLVLAWCRECLGLDETETWEAMGKLRSDPRTADVVRRLEEWLHAPGEIPAQRRNSAEQLLETLEKMLADPPTPSVSVPASAEVASPTEGGR